MKKYFLTFFIFSISLFSYATQYFIATNGNDNNIGSVENPFAGFDKAYSVVQPGDTIWVRGGNYTINSAWTIDKAGNMNQYYNLWGYENDVLQGDSVILNVSATNGIRIRINGAYWHIKNLVVQNSSDNGIRIEGSYNIIEKCIFRNNADSGLTIQQSNGTMPNDGTIAAFNLVLNCDSYYNDKDVSNADGFACKLSPGAGNVFRGCRSWANGDDGWDFYYSRFQIIVEDCWTFTNGIKGGNGNGFKSNGSASSSSTPRTQATHVYIRCIAFDHKYKSGANNKGFDQNHNEGNVTIINCLSFDNEKNYAYSENAQNGKNHIFRNNVGFEPYSEKLARTLLPGEVINGGTKDEISYDASNTWFGNTIDAAFNSWNLTLSNPGWVPSRNDYRSLSIAEAKAQRQADGSLPDNGFGRLKPESKMKNAGISYHWELELPITAYPSNPNKPYYVNSTYVTTVDGLPDLGPFEIPATVNPNNIAPIVSISQPLNDSEFLINEEINIEADASDSDGFIARVEFYVDNNLIGFSFDAPYKLNWTSAESGLFQIIAKAYDNEGLSSISEPISIQINRDEEGFETGEKINILSLDGNSFVDAIQGKTWTTINSTSISKNHIKLTFSSNKGGTIISPAITLSQFIPDSLKLSFASSGGGNRNLNIYLSSDGGTTYSSAYVQNGAANGIPVTVKFPLSDKVSGEGNFVLKLEAAGTIELWDIQVTAHEKIKTNIDFQQSLSKQISCKSIINSGKLILEINSPESKNLQIHIFNSNGNLIIGQNKYLNQGINYIINDISHVSDGIYFVKLHSPEENFVFKIIKRK